MNHMYNKIIQNESKAIFKILGTFKQWNSFFSHPTTAARESDAKVLIIDEKSLILQLVINQYYNGTC